MNKNLVNDQFSNILTTMKTYGPPNLHIYVTLSTESEMLVKTDGILRLDLLYYV